jgi:hypothetical protein
MSITNDKSSFEQENYQPSKLQIEDLTNEDEVSIIEYYHSNEILWKHSLSKFSQTSNKEHLITELARQIGTTGL